MFTIKKYTPLFPTIPAVWAVLFYFKFFGITVAPFSGGPILQAVRFVVCILPLSLMGYYPTFTTKNKSQVQEEEFYRTGQGYLEAAAIGALGWGLNWVSCPPFIKYYVFLIALPAIHFLCTRRIDVKTREVLHYPDVARPLNPDE